MELLRLAGPPAVHACRRPTTALARQGPVLLEHAGIQTKRELQWRRTARNRQLGQLADLLEFEQLSSNASALLFSHVIEFFTRAFEAFSVLTVLTADETVQETAHE